MQAFKHKAAELAARLQNLGNADGMKIIEASTENALYFDGIGEAMCIMHMDGSVNIIDHIGMGNMTVEVISAGNILKVLMHYRPFKEVFKQNVQ
jgi:hypothetical protein